jgi:hypothetical protein
MNASESHTARGIRRFALAGVLVLAVALCAGVVACGGDETPAEPEVAPASPVDAATAPENKPKQAKQAAVEMPEPDLSGLEATIGEGAAIPEDFPSDVPIYPGARPTATMSEAGEGTLVTFDIDDGPEKVYDFYQQKFSDGGWEIASSASMGGQWMISALKDQRAAHVSIAGDGSGTQLGIAVAKAE